VSNEEEYKKPSMDIVITSKNKDSKSN